MKKKYFFILSVSLVLLASCSHKVYQITAEGERFDALTQITDGEKICLYPQGGDFGTNLVFVVKEDNSNYNIYLKDDVLKKAYLKKTSGDNINLAPQYCSASDRIVFQFYDKTNFDIYYIDANKGKAITQITNTDEDEFNPAWSPDGNMIIFERGQTPQTYVQANIGNKPKVVSIRKNQIWIQNIKTNELKMLGEGSFPKISNDGKKIVFVKYGLDKKKTDENGTLWTMTIDGDSPRQITTATIGYAKNPNWSPDGKNLIFELTKSNKTDSDIYTIDINGENLKQYTTNKSNDFAPYWSVDDFVYFASDRKYKAKQYQIWRFKIK
jgi:Tol biopolymer transport system component